MFSLLLKDLISDFIFDFTAAGVVLYVISSTFKTYDNFSELIRKISPTTIFFLMYILSHHKIPVSIGLDIKVFLIQH